MAGVALGRHGAQPEQQVVAMRADQAHPAIELVRPGLGDRLQELRRQQVAVGRERDVSAEAGHVHQVGVGRPVRDRRIGRAHPRPQQVHQLQPGGDQLGSLARQVGVPHVQRRQVRRRPALAQRSTRRLEQRVALLEHPVVVGPHASHPRLTGDEQVVEETAAIRRVALDQREVLGGEQHGAQDAQYLAGPRDGRGVDAGPVGPAGGDLQLDQGGSTVADHPSPDHGPRGPLADQRGVGRHPMAVQRRQVADGLDQVGLALPVRADERRHPGLQRQLDRCVGAEVGQRQVADVHGCGDGRRRVSRTGGPA